MSHPMAHCRIDVHEAAPRWTTLLDKALASRAEIKVHWCDPEQAPIKLSRSSPAVIVLECNASEGALDNIQSLRRCSRCEIVCLVRNNHWAFESLARELGATVVLGIPVEPDRVVESVSRICVRNPSHS